MNPVNGRLTISKGNDESAVPYVVTLRVGAEEYSCSLLEACYEVAVAGIELTDSEYAWICEWEETQ
jgi:hypothetical protein